MGKNIFVFIGTLWNHIKMNRILRNRNVVWKHPEESKRNYYHSWSYRNMNRDWLTVSTVYLVSNLTNVRLLKISLRNSSRKWIIWYVPGSTVEQYEFVARWKVCSWTDGDNDEQLALWAATVTQLVSTKVFHLFYIYMIVNLRGCLYKQVMPPNAKI